jgi:Deoxycytidylate deaminase
MPILSPLSNPHLPRKYAKAQTFLKIAAELGELSTCDRAAVGALIVRDGRCIAWGYNGAPPGLPHCHENNHGWSESYHLPSILETEGCRNVTHAEANAVAFAARQGISTEGATLYVTLSPCEVCARLIIAAGITAVMFEKEYRKDRGILLLKKAGVKIFG